ncbi:hypothetical protein EUTSA_v10001698mg [Eutrema salsugineum]|uniref:Uncharacterized protein n=1 Tax=Eutrema salsugineum TaxID=72664 RepID=V4KN81_EUTSA|nr:uncharacterized protein LOC18015659 [Eutrema salsugineum]ESQ39365.1 hypothetical protein EUTSA_v10001698mg [Eutrema salsugineum]
MASIVMLLRALMSCRLTPREEPETTDSSTVDLYRNVAGDKDTTRKRISVVDTWQRSDNHEFNIETTRRINDMDEEFDNWIIARNHLMM